MLPKGTPVVVTDPDIQDIYNAILSEDWDDVLHANVWPRLFNERPEPLLREEKQAWLSQYQDVCLGSDAFFPFGDNIERAAKSGVRYVAQPGGSIRDEQVIETCDRFGIVMAMTGLRLFHH